MPSVLLDTHAWAWSMLSPDRISEVARNAIDAATEIYVSPISFYEIGQKVRIGKWPEMAPHVPSLPDLLRSQNGNTAAITSEVAVLAGSMEWAHRDPFDRFIAATVLISDTPLVSADTAFDCVPGQHGTIRRIW